MEGWCQRPPSPVCPRPYSYATRAKLQRVTVDRRQHCTDGSVRLCRWRAHREALSEDSRPAALSTHGPSVALHVLRNLATYRERVVRALLSHYNNDPLQQSAVCVSVATPPLPGVSYRGSRRAGRLGVPAFQEPPRTGVVGRRRWRGTWRLAGRGASRGLTHGAALGAGAPWRLRPGHRGHAAAANTCWAAATPAPRATG